jgi:vacuolar protein sorting-associated protein 1
MVMTCDFVAQGSVVLAAITEFAAEFRGAIDGNREDLAQNELSGGARIGFVFHELYNTAIKSFDPFDQVKDGDIRTILYNSSVRTLSGLSSISQTNTHFLC